VIQRSSPLLLAVLLQSLTASTVLGQTVPSATPQLSREWKRIQGADVEVVGNASEKDLREALARVEAFRSALKYLNPWLQLSAAEPTRLVIFRDYPFFERFLPRDGRGRRQQNVGGFFGNTPTANLMVLPMSGDRDRAFVTIFHEYTHHVMHHNAHNMPSWLDEGLADFYSTFTVRSNGERIIGTAPIDRLTTLRSRSMRSFTPLLTGQWQIRFENVNDVLMFYAQSWLLVHHLTLSDGGLAAPLWRYLELLKTTSSPEDAAVKAFGGSIRGLDEQLQQYSRRMTMPAIVLPPGSARDTAPGQPISPMSEAEALVLQGDLLLQVGAPASEVEGFLAKAMAVEPANVEARVAAARLHSREERHEDAVSTLKEIAARNPESFTAQFFLGRVAFEAEQYDASLTAYRAAAVLRGQSAHAWYGASQAALMLARESESDAALERARQIYSSPSWHYRRASVALRAGRDRAASSDARQFIDRAGWGDTSAPYAAFIAAIAHWRLGESEQANQMLAAAGVAAASTPWTATVVQYLRGAIDERDFLNRARDNGQRTEAHAYTGMKMVLAGKIDEARTHFVWVKNNGDRHFTEYALARAELKRLERSASTPQ
jgi:tetratricopeptide (TPR) repeat protein